MLQLRPGLFVAIFSGCLLSSSPSKAAVEEDWLDDLYSEVAVDLKAGKPLVIQVHVPLCENSIIACGNKKLGDGDNPSTNLYWSTSGGFKGWFKRAPGWKLLHTITNAEGPVLETIVWRKTFKSTKTWRDRGVTAGFDVVVVAAAWRGTEITQAIDTYVRDLYRSTATSIELGDGSTVAAGGAAHIVAYVGHNGWMDLPPYDWKAAEKLSASRPKGTIAIACLTADYLAEAISDPRRVPLLMTTSLLFAGAHGFEGAVSAFAEGKSLSGVRTSAAKNYATGQDKPLRNVTGAFTNPADTRWKRYFRLSK